MNLLAILTIAFIVLACVFAPLAISGMEMDSCYPTKTDKVVFLGSSIITVICSILIIFSLTMIAFMPDENYTTEIVSSSSIVALNDGFLIEGYGGFLRSSYIEEELYYFYMKDMGDGSYAMQKAPADRTFICYTDDNFRIEVLEKTYNLGCFFYQVNNVYYIYVPKGTITEEFTIDLNY